LGCAPDVWDDTVNWAKSKHYEMPLMEQAGLILRKEGSDHHYDRFRGRLIFPICDEQGRVVAFSGRILTGDEKTAKYVNSPETPIFTKGKVMFGLDKSKRALLETHRAVICEGQLDLIACFMAGVTNVVAPQGTALTSEHTRILKRYVDEVVLCFDSDNAGQKAAVRSLDSLLASGLAIRVATVPAPHDPDSFIKELGGAAFAQVIEKAPSFFDYYLDRLCATHDPATDLGRGAIVQEMAQALYKTGSEVLRDTYAQKTALRLGVAAEALRQEFRKTARAPAVDTEESTEATAPATRPTQHEWWLLRVLLENDDQCEWVAAHLDVAWLPTPDAREIISQRMRLDEEWPGAAAWLSQPENSRWQSLVSEILADSRPIPDATALVQGSPTRDGIVKILRDKDIERRLAELNRQLAASDASEMSGGLVEEMQRLRQLKKLPLSGRSDQDS
jgi:DNA primase